MPLWESNEIYFLAGFSVLVTLGVFASLAYFVYKKVVTDGRRADEEQAALEKVLLRKEPIPSTSGPPTKPLIVSPSFSSPNKVPARHLRSGSYSPTHYLSPYHIRQPRRNSSPTSAVAIQTPKLPQLVLQHPQQSQQLQQETISEEGSPAPDTNNGVDVVDSGGAAPTGSETACVPLIKPNNNEAQRGGGGGGGNMIRHNVPGSLAHHNSQYYGTISPRRGRSGVVAPAETSPGGLGSHQPPHAFLPLKCAAGTVLVPNMKNGIGGGGGGGAFIKSEYVQLPGKDGGLMMETESEWKNKEDSCGGGGGSGKLWKNCSEHEDGALRRKLLLQKQYQQKLQLHQNNHQHRNSSPPGELFKMRNALSEEIPYYISSQ